MIRSPGFPKSRKDGKGSAHNYPQRASAGKKVGTCHDLMRRNLRDSGFYWTILKTPSRICQHFISCHKITACGVF
jgi:hypothetical protein